LIQKKITAFTVEFIVTTVDDQERRHSAMSELLSNMLKTTRPEEAKTGQQHKNINTIVKRHV
jgi:hypothetical protein